MGRDKITKAQRSALMARVKSEGTSLEKVVVYLLSKAGIHDFRTNDRMLPGRPDIVFAEKRLAVFIHGDFWHGWQFPRWKEKLKNNYWKTKIQRNRSRDRNVYSKLRRKGWKVLTIWEHQLTTGKMEVLDKLKSAL